MDAHAGGSEIVAWDTILPRLHAAVEATSLRAVAAQVGGISSSAPLKVVRLDGPSVPYDRSIRKYVA